MATAEEKLLESLKHMAANPSTTEGSIPGSPEFNKMMDSAYKLFKDQLKKHSDFILLMAIGLLAIEKKDNEANKDLIDAFNNVVHPAIEYGNTLAKFIEVMDSQRKGESS